MYVEKNTSLDNTPWTPDLTHQAHSSINVIHVVAYEIILEN